MAWTFNDNKTWAYRNDGVIAKYGAGGIYCAQRGAFPDEARLVPKEPFQSLEDAMRGADAAWPVTQK